MLKQRVLTSLWFAPLFVAVVWFGGNAGFTVLIAVFGVLAVLEFYRMTANAKAPPLTYFGMVWTALFIISRNPEILSIISTWFNTDLLLPILLSSAMVISFFCLLGRRQKESAFASWAWTIAGILYIGWFLSHLTGLRGLEDGHNWVYFVLFVTWVSDTAAYFIGRRFGRHKLAPSISPGKTWEGTMAGICGAIITSILFFTPSYFTLPLAPWQAITLAVLVSIMGQIGDLVESLLKRNMGIKDSGQLMAGHGGILDRLDSLLFAGIVVYYYATWVI